MDDTCQRAVQDLQEDGGWEAVQDSVALQDRQQDALDHIIQVRAQSVAHALTSQGWERSGAAGFQHPEFPDIRIVGNGTTSRSGGNMVQWGYRLIMNRGQNHWTGTNIPDGFHEEAETFAQRLIENAVEMANRMNSDLSGVSSEQIAAMDTRNERKHPDQRTDIAPEVNGLDETADPLLQGTTEEAVIPSAIAASFGTTDPIAREMLAKIEASPYSLPYLLGDDRARDSDDPPYEEDTEWAAARVRFTDEIDAILNARVRANVDALREQGWAQPILHGDLTHENAVIRLEPRLNADGDMQGLAYRVSIASDTEGLLTRTVPDFLQDSSARFASELHRIAEQEIANQESLQRTLDAYIIQHIHEHAPQVAQQAKANTLDQFHGG